ncbi:hypothetical protein PA01_00745 [Azoarcus sp. PA01]|nr:hypothetical protein PA01_20000 [Azoarcus sp. PA01]KON82595.1 hypothetical protein PA01_00745 [Azoarcus sp. PA01]
MRHAIMWGHCKDNPVREVKPFKETPRTRYVTDAEFEAVKRIASPIVAALMDLARLTGQRRGDLLALRRDAITLYLRQFSIHNTPTRQNSASLAVTTTSPRARPRPTIWQS